MQKVKFRLGSMIYLVWTVSKDISGQHSPFWTPNYKINIDYIGETEKILKARFMEHRRQSSSTSEVSQHINKDCPGHSVDMESVRILDRAPS